jgi:DNA-directed RNA polymerase specialized sigma24 family protein
MPTDPQDALRAAVQAAQQQYESDAATAREARRNAFAMAQEKGLSLREIGELVGLDHSRIRQIIRGE